MSRLKVGTLLCYFGRHKWEDIPLPPGTVYPHGQRYCSRCDRVEILHKTLDGYQEWKVKQKGWI